MSADIHITIMGGPSKFDLITALFIRTPKNPVVTFRTKLNKETYAAIITGVAEREDGSGESYNISGYAWHIYTSRRSCTYPFKGYYSITRREGLLTLSDPD